MRILLNMQYVGGGTREIDFGSGLTVNVTVTASTNASITVTKTSDSFNTTTLSANCTIKISVPSSPAAVRDISLIDDNYLYVKHLAGKRETIVTKTRNAIDFANALKFTSDTMYPMAEKIVLVTDNLNTHSPSSLYKAFPPDEAHRLANRFEWHYTPKQGTMQKNCLLRCGGL